MKRTSTASTPSLMGSPVKTPKYVLHSGSSSSPVTSLGVAINSLPPNTIIKATTRPSATPPSGTSSPASSTSHPTVSAAPRVASVVRQAVFTKRDMPQRTMRSMTLTLIENSPLLHLGIVREHMTILKRHICRIANVTHLDCCITLRKLRQNEPFALLAEYFELSESDVEETFKRTLIRLARCMRALICWPNTQQFYDRLKQTPVDYRANLLHVRSLIECVETDVWKPLEFACSSYKFILCINTNGIVSYISPAFPGECDDLQMFEATNFNDIIPNYLTLCAEPGQAVQRERRDPQMEDEYGEEDDFRSESKQPALTKFEAQRLTGELAQQQSLSIIDGCLISKKAPSMQLPTLRNSEPAPACRLQMQDAIDRLREYKILEHNAIQQKSLLGYLNELLIVVAGLCNLKRQGL
ncbi:uncharacterized protein Dwil_GK17925 [Drosophila willistoni]|uniref:DDE Tnp4 domain-containing protein n=1 Tax=Drosophila willistoni TaxID=7260 RepID=B4N5R3_DROWI|nr:uncharacterized protein LOC6646276 [Drosophila willistoni]EDW79702.2 uncharacterized protein Dwil_GK17925 [Drosophila willistoni]